MSKRRRHRVRNRQPRLYTAERVAWNAIRGTNQRCVSKRRSLDKHFSIFFPKGLDEGELMHTLVTMFSVHVAEGGIFHPTSHARWLEQIHPDVFRLLARHGTFYKPVRLDSPPKTEPEPGKCFHNARKLVFSRDKHTRKRKGQRMLRPLLYVEGVAFGPIAAPMHHAWNTTRIESRKAIDWTFYATSPWVRYLGIPLTAEEYRELRTVSPPRRKNFPIFQKGAFNLKVRVKLLEIISRRKWASKRKPL